MKRTEEKKRQHELEKQRKLLDRLQKKKEREERVDRYWKRVFNNAVQNKASELNKIMNGRDVKDVKHDGTWFTVYFKNGQVFNFTFLPPAIYGDRKIIPILE